MMFPKAKPARDKKWRERVAGMACVGCGLEGSSQAAHSRGFGTGMKASDYLCIPLCAARPGAEGCHAQYDRDRTLGKLTRDAAAEIVNHELQRLSSLRLGEALRESLGPDWLEGKP